MIDLTIDLAYLARYYGISSLRQYISPAQASAQNKENSDELTIVTEDGMITVNKDLLLKLLQDPEKLAKIMKLESPENRYLIIQQFNEEDLVKVLPYLNSEQLSFGLQYFTVDGLEELLNNLPAEQLIFLLLQHFTMEDVTRFMQENEMSEFFESTHLAKKDVLEYFEGLEYEKFQKLMMNQFGPDFKDKSAKEYLEYIENMEDREYKRFLQNMQTPEKAEAITGLCEINPDYYYEFDNSILVRPMINLMEKEDIIKTMKTLDPEFLIPMIEELPKDLIQVVATQVDHNDFAEMLSSEFPEMLMQMLQGK